ncbi:MAG: ATP-binding cassette domain-containing protein [Acetobacter sp.]|nr:ATP-binding cassette domain-containing protein [Bacteroides sp.]MCM1341498.1 ATP-binding cassette domain-containing protein [Acetobacter sp.]MCM1433714.1 ATP-binding cassette domain-containing protein [Clostridiales bacterium]
MAVLKTENLSFTYPDSDRMALDSISVEINSGEMILIMGKTGSGKSTLLRMLKKELTPAGKTEGNITINAKSVAFVQQNPDTSFVAEKVRGELAFALENKCMPNNEIALRIGEIASYFNIIDLLDKEVSKLSGGEKAVVQIAASMITDADVIILDEPFSQLDPKACRQIIDVVKRINEELGITVLLSSHECDGIVDICDRIIVLESGKIIADDSPDIISKNDNLINFFPCYTALFEERPLSIKSAVSFAGVLKEKSIQYPAESKIVLEAKKITFSYARREKDVLCSLSYKAYKGKIHAIAGANGSGKTTLLKALAGIKKCYAGKIKREGKPAYLPQNVKYLFTKDTVGEEINIDTAKKFDLESCINQHPYDLSGGQMQKLALAILSQQNFDILLLDEPSKCLDSSNKEMLKLYMKSLADNGKTIIFVSHDMDFISETADYVSFLADGIITLTGDRRTVLSSLNFYTSSIRRITRKYLKSCTSAEDLL